MNAVDELRRLLQKRGVECLHTSVKYWNSVGWKDSNGYLVRAEQWGDALLVQQAVLTPEQAVDVTLGRETCRMQPVDDLHPADGVVCKQCGTVFRVTELDVDGDYLISDDELECVPNYCPVCGRRVVE